MLFHRAAIGAIISTKINGEIGTYLGLVAVIFATVKLLVGSWLQIEC